MKKIFLFIAAYFCLQTLSGQALTKPEYKTLIKKHFDLLTRDYSEGKIVAEFQKKNLRWMCNLMADYVTMYRLTGEKKYLNKSVYVFKTGANLWRQDKQFLKGTDDFFCTKHVAYTYKYLQQFGMIGKEYEDAVQLFADSHFQPDFVNDDNQAQERALGFALMLQVLPDYPNRQNWKKYVDKIWNHWYKNLDIDETATNYSAIHIYDIIRIAESEGKINLLKCPEIKKWLDRYYHQQAPSGYMPEYGDDYFFSYLRWVACFEKMARLFNDRNYQQAAWKLFNIGYPNIPEKHYTNKFNPNLASEWALLAEVIIEDDIKTTKKTVDEPASMVTTRIDKYGEVHPDQLLLASSRKPGTPFLMSDLYAKGGHAHFYLRGTINYLEMDNTPVYHGVQRHAKDARCGNTVVLTKNQTKGFPFEEGQSRKTAGKWFSDYIDFSTSTYISDIDPSMRGFKEITLRMQNMEGEEIYVNKVFLRGKKGILPLSECNKLSEWRYSKDVDAQVVKDEERGEVIRFGLKNNKVHFITLLVSKDFSLNDYQFIELEWKRELPANSNPDKMNFLIRVQNIRVLPGEGYVDAPVGTLPNVNKLTEAFAEDKDKDCFGKIVLDDHFVSGTKLERRMVLTQEGILVIQDFLYPSAGAIGFASGSIWQMYNVSQKGENWFNAAVENWKDYTGKRHNKELLVYFENKKERKYAAQKADYSVRPIVVSSSETITTTQPICFITVVIPHDGDIKPENYVQNIVTKTKNNGSIVILKVENRKIEININNNNWTVKRL